ncbi:apolipoprotein D-like [Engraulis encrasicolus]|uniref:apolipoprotein D-like n=1 Tax=Engraulis encrasicolus TaxID=184585 RepID=UPI002FD01422
MQAAHVLLLALLPVVAVRAQSPQPGKCAVPPVQQNFDVGRYAGRWYDIQKLPAVFQKGKCSQATYTARSDGQISVLNQSLQPDGAVTSTVGTAWAPDMNEPAKLVVRFVEGKRPGPYWVLSTDYESYSLVFSCTQLSSEVNVNFAWILSRSRSLPAETITQLEDKLRSYGIKIDNMTVTDQTGCSAMPA